MKVWANEFMYDEKVMVQRADGKSKIRYRNNWLKSMVLKIEVIISA